MSDYAALLQASQQSKLSAEETKSDVLELLPHRYRSEVESIPVLVLPYRDLDAFAAKFDGGLVIGFSQALFFVVDLILAHVYAVIHPDRFNLVDAYARFVAIALYIAKGGTTAIPRQPTLWSPPFFDKLGYNQIEAAIDYNAASAGRFIRLLLLLHEYFHIICGHLNVQEEFDRFEILTSTPFEIAVYPESIKLEIEADKRTLETLLKSRRGECERFLPVYHIFLSQLDLALAIIAEKYGVQQKRQPWPIERQQVTHEIYIEVFGETPVLDWAIDVSEVFTAVKKGYLSMSNTQKDEIELMYSREGQVNDQNTIPSK
jgi:hypothetical protein